MKSHVVFGMLLVLITTVSLTSTTTAQANTITRTIAPDSTSFNQGDKFIVTLSVSVTDRFATRLKVTDKVVYPAMEIIGTVNRSVTSGELRTVVLNQQLDSIELTSESIVAPVSFTVTYQAVCCMAGSFYLPPTKLSVYTTLWADYSPGPYRLMTIISNAEITLTNLLNGLSAKVTTIDGRVVSLDGKITDVSNNVISIKTDVGTIKGTIQSIQGDTATIRTDIGTIKVQIPNLIQNSVVEIQKNGEALQNNTDQLSRLDDLVDQWGHYLDTNLHALLDQNMMYSQAAVAIAVVAAAGAWIAVVVVAMRKKTTTQ